MTSLRTMRTMLPLPFVGCAWTLSTVLLLCCGLVLGCSSVDDAEVADDTISGAVDVEAQRARFGTLSTAGLDVVTFDLNTDGHADQTHYLRGGELARVERDLNFDGVTDTYEHYKDAVLVQEELDLDLDGIVDVVVDIVDGQVEQKRYAMGFRADLVIAQWYSPEGQLLRVERDTNGDGVVDLWEHFKPGESRAFRRQIDTDGDGEPDKNQLMDNDG